MQKKGRMSTLNTHDTKIKNVFDVMVAFPNVFVSCLYILVVFVWWYAYLHAGNKGT